MTPNRRFSVGLAVLTAGALAFVAWKRAGYGGTTITGPANPEAPKVAAAKPAPVGFDLVLSVLADGGSPLALEEAIGFLDKVTRLGKGLTIPQHTALLDALEHGAPTGMVEGPWSHIFNSACNALAVNQSAADEKLLSLLERIVVDDSRLVMRLYALQHIGVRYDTAGDNNQKRLQALVRRLLAEPDSQVAGTALLLWRRWEKSAEPGGPSSMELSRAIAEDVSRPVDVRVTALHVIGEDPAVLELARSIAKDHSQPVILRKSALNLIGRHGESQDLAVLRLCSQESPRLAQASEPAARVLQDRLAGKSQPVLVPY